VADQTHREAAPPDQLVVPVYAGDGVSPRTLNNSSVGRQALRREVNRRVRDAARPNESTDAEIFCECGRRLCADHLRIELDLYEEVVNSPGRYVVTTHHDNDPTQRLISRHHGFLVVERA
jgi:hypothetical protein